jgi:hypothetical protein
VEISTMQVSPVVISRFVAIRRVWTKCNEQRNGKTSANGASTAHLGTKYNLLANICHDTLSSQVIRLRCCSDCMNLLSLCLIENIGRT